MTQCIQYIMDVSVLHAAIIFSPLHLAMAAAHNSETSIDQHVFILHKNIIKFFTEVPPRPFLFSNEKFGFRTRNGRREKSSSNVAEEFCLPHSGPDLTTSTQLDTHICYLGRTASSSGPHSRITYRIVRAIFHTQVRIYANVTPTESKDSNLSL